MVPTVKPLLHWLVRNAGLRRQTVELDPWTSIDFWVPQSAEEGKPAVLLVHGFAGDGTVTWPFQILALAGRYSVFVPDLLFFGESRTDAADRTPAFQPDCLAAALGWLGVRRCSAVGFSYGGMVASSLAERWPGLVGSLVLSSSVFVMTESISSEMQRRLGVSSWPEFLLPESEKELKALLSVSVHMKLWLPHFLYKDFLHAMFKKTKQKVELLEAMVVAREEDRKIPFLPKRTLVVYGENDNIFHLQLAHDMKEQHGESIMVKTIEKAGHLLHLERPFVFNKHLEEFLGLYMLKSPAIPDRSLIQMLTCYLVTEYRKGSL